MGISKRTRNGRTTYRARWNYRTDPETGRRVSDEREFTTLKAAEKHLASIGEHGLPTDTTVRALTDLWLKAHQPGLPTTDTRPWQYRTANDYAQQCRLRIVPYLGKDRVDALTPKRITAWKRWMRQPTQSGEARHGARSADKALQALKTCIRWGRGRGLTTNTLIDDVPGVPSDPPAAANPHPPSVVEAISAACKTMQDATFIMVAAYSGLRWSELRGLQWGDVDWDREVIHVQRSIDGDGARSVKPPKSGKHRQVPVLKPGIEALRAWRSMNEREPLASYVFRTKQGRPLGQYWYTKNLPQIRKDSGVEFTPHELRDTYASILIATGIGEAELTMWLGHSSIDVTLRRYAGLFAARQTTLAAKANALLSTLG